MNLKVILILLFCAFPLILFGQTKRQFEIKYISSENVYLSGGRSNGLTVGDTLVVKHGKRFVASLVVQYVSEHSASCRIIESKGKVTTDAAAILVKKHPSGRKAELKNKKRTRRRKFSRRTKQETREEKFADFSGSVSLQWYHIEDLKYSRMNFDQPTLRVNFKMRNIGGKDYNLRIRTRSRYYSRSSNYSTRLPRTDWQNRIYQVSFSYDNDEALLNYKFGRIISNKFSGVGYIDGALLQANLTQNVHFGIFAGTQPEWRSSKFQTSLQKYGGYFNFVKGDYRNFRFESTLAFAGEYHGSSISREFIYFQNNFYSRKRFSFYQSAELDINRKWRKERTNENISLTSLYLSLNFDISDNITTSLSYDNRKNYWTYEIHSLADSLFDDAFRHGLRAHLNVRLGRTYYLFANVGTRKRESDAQTTYSYVAGLNGNNFLNKKLFFNLYFSGFSNYYAKGMNPSITLGRYFSGGHRLAIKYGNYRYKLTLNDTNRENQWVRVDASFELWHNFYLFSQFEYNWGNDSRDQRILTELGYRF